jgi:hypothetical protein
MVETDPMVVCLFIIGLADEAVNGPRLRALRDVAGSSD